MCFFLHHTSTYPQGSHHKHRVFGPRFFYRAPRAGGLLFFFTFTERVWPFLAGVLSGLLVLAPTAVAEALGTRLAAVGSVCGLAVRVCRAVVAKVAAAPPLAARQRLTLGGLHPSPTRAPSTCP